LIVTNAKVEPLRQTKKGRAMSLQRFRFVPRVFLCLFFIAVTTVCHAGSKVTLGLDVASSSLVSMDRLSHSAWHTLLQKYVDVRGNVNYTAWQRSASDVQALDNYLNMLSYASPKIRAGREAQFAFWINAYNAVTVKGILREYPTTSIRNHTAKVLGYNIWHDLLLTVGGQQYSLDQIEHKVLRPMGDPRVHFAIVCASHSCPRLLNEAYTAQRLEQQLVANTRNFFANRENFRQGNGTFYLSAILKWFADDFGDSQAVQLRSIAPYLPDRASYEAAANGSGRVSYLDYDWSLNDQKTAQNVRR
jgi:hypothetical protein